MFFIILSSLPSNIASVEKNLSSLRIIKTWIRCRISEVKLSDLAIIHTHKKNYIDVNLVTDTLENKRNQKIVSYLIHFKYT